MGLGTKRRTPVVDRMKGNRLRDLGRVMLCRRGSGRTRCGWEIASSGGPKDTGGRP